MRELLCALLFVTSCWGLCPAVPDGELPDGLEEAFELHEVDEGELPDGLEETVELHEGEGGKIVEQGDHDNTIIQDSKSMSEVVDAATSDKMDAIFNLEGKKTTALAVLEYMLKETTIDPEYLTNLFYQKAKVQSNEELEKKIFTEDRSLKFLSNILQHFQENPDAGRPSGETENLADQKDAQTESDNENEGTTIENDGKKVEL